MYRSTLKTMGILNFAKEYRELQVLHNGYGDCASKILNPFMTVYFFSVTVGIYFYFIQLCRSNATWWITVLVNFYGLSAIVVALGLFTLAGQLQAFSNVFNRRKYNLMQEKKDIHIYNSCPPLQVAVGSFFYIKKSNIVTFFHMALIATFKLCIFERNLKMYN